MSTEYKRKEGLEGGKDKGFFDDLIGKFLGFGICSGTVGSRVYL